MIDWARLTWPEAQAAAARMPVAILPTGAIEAHGPHMTLEADNRAADALARRLAERTGAVLLPLLPYGQVWSLSRFPGSLSISNETLKALICDLGRSLAGQGFAVLAIVNGHLGNATALKEAARALYGQVPLRVLHLFYPGLHEAATGVLERPRSHPAIVHADELETSLLLDLAPECVQMEKAVAEYPEYPPDFDVTPQYWDGVCRSGVFGDATAATQAKGEHILAAVLERMVALVERAQAEG